MQLHCNKTAFRLLSSISLNLNSYWWCNNYSYVIRTHFGSSVYRVVPQLVALPDEARRYCLQYLRQCCLEHSAIQTIFSNSTLSCSAVQLDFRGYNLQSWFGLRNLVFPYPTAFLVMKGHCRICLCLFFPVFFSTLLWKHKTLFSKLWSRKDTFIGYFKW